VGRAGRKVDELYRSEQNVQYFSLARLDSGAVWTVKRLGVSFDTDMVAKKMAGSSSSRANILRWDQSNKNYILTHSVSGVDWQF
jgi:hypothetical protein